MKSFLLFRAVLCVNEKNNTISSRCDAKEQEEGNSYIRVTNLLQGIVENEVDMNNIKTCRDSCSTYRVAETEGRCFKNKFCAKQRRCNGRLFDCKFYDADAWICMSQERERRYDWIEYEDHTILGRKGQCPSKEHNTIVNELFAYINVSSDRRWKDQG